MKTEVDLHYRTLSKITLSTSGLPDPVQWPEKIPSKKRALRTSPFGSKLPASAGSPEAAGLVGGSGNPSGLHPYVSRSELSSRARGAPKTWEVGVSDQGPGGPTGLGSPGDPKSTAPPGGARGAGPPANTQLRSRFRPGALVAVWAASERAAFLHTGVPRRRCPLTCAGTQSLRCKVGFGTYGDHRKSKKSSP